MENNQNTIVKELLEGVKLQGLTTADMINKYPTIIEENKKQFDKDKSLEEWKKSRIGFITGSQFPKVKKLKTNRGGKLKGDFTQTAVTYLIDIIGEYLTNEPHRDFTSKSVTWGIDHEDEARELYSRTKGVEVDPGKFLTLGKHKIGCTVDGFVTDGDRLGVLEIKCPYVTSNHLRVMINNEVPEEYWEQVLGHILISGYDFCDFVSYDPRCKEEFKMHIIRIERDKFIFELEELEQNLFDFEKELKKELKKLKIK